MRSDSTSTLGCPILAASFRRKGGRPRGYYHFKHNTNEQILFCYGHSVAGQTENYAYTGIYWTWGKNAKDKADEAKPQQAFFPNPYNSAILNRGE